jgi:hypothetical protein
MNHSFSSNETARLILFCQPTNQQTFNYHTGNNTPHPIPTYSTAMSKSETIAGLIVEWEDYLRSLGDDSSSDEANRSPVQSPTTPIRTTTTTGSILINPPSSAVLPPGAELPSGVLLFSRPPATSRSRTNSNPARRGPKSALAKRQTSYSDSEDDESQIRSWTTKDEKILQASRTNELRLWGRLVKSSENSSIS